MQQKSNLSKKSLEKSAKNNATLKEYLLVRDAFLEKYGMKGKSDNAKKAS